MEWVIRLSDLGLKPSELLEVKQALENRSGVALRITLGFLFSGSLHDYELSERIAELKEIDQQAEALNHRFAPRPPKPPRVKPNRPPKPFCLPVPKGPRKQQLIGLALIKRTAREICKKAIRQGLIVRQPCERCGDENSQAHHEDYSKPLEVNWLCRTHHWCRHAEMKAAA